MSDKWCHNSLMMLCNVLNFVHAPLNAIWIIFKRGMTFFLFYKIEWVKVILVLAINGYVNYF